MQADKHAKAHAHAHERGYLDTDIDAKELAKPPDGGLIRMDAGAKDVEVPRRSAGMRSEMKSKKANTIFGWATKTPIKKMPTNPAIKPNLTERNSLLLLLVFCVRARACAACLCVCCACMHLCVAPARV